MSDSKISFYDALNATTDIARVITARPMGCDIATQQSQRSSLLTLIPPAPHTFTGTRPSKSPDIRRFCPGGHDNQVIGMCTGKGGRNACGTLVRIPEGADSNSKPLPTIRFSGLFNYYNARWIARDHGNGSGGEGAVPAYMMIGMQKYGVITEEWCDDSDASQNAYSDRRKPSSPKGDIYAEAAKHLVIQCARITSGDQVLDYLGAGFPIVIGKPIPQGYMQTADDGRFTLNGRTVGGHCTVIVDYDEKLNQIWERGSWEGWGQKTADPEFADEGGRNVLGYCNLDEYKARHLSTQAFQSGETDAFVINVIDGFEKPKIVTISPGETF